MEFKSAEWWKQQTEFPGLGRKLKILAFIPNDGGCAYYRIIMPMRKLAQLYPNVVEITEHRNPLGWSTSGAFEEKIDHEAFEANDFIFTNNLCNWGGNYNARVVGIAKEHNKVHVFDTDDLLTDLYAGHRLESVYKEKGLSEITKFIYNHSGIVTVTQRKFANRIEPFIGPGNMLAVIKNAIDYTLPSWNQPRTEVYKNKFVRVGWAGGIHHEEDVKEFAGIPWLVNQKVGKERVRWDFYGKPPHDPKNPEKWQQDVWANYEKVICRGFKNYKNYTINPALPADHYGVMFANMDIAIAPLQMNPFNDSKSDIKVAECSRYKVPLIASNVGCYSDTIKNGSTGYLIDPAAPKSEWVRALSSLIKDPDRMREMGQRLHDQTKDLFDIDKVIHDRLNIYAEYFQN